MPYSGCSAWQGMNPNKKKKEKKEKKSFSKSLRAATGWLLEKPNMGKALAINMMVKNLFQG